MVSDYVMTEGDVRGERAAPDGVVIGGYQIDSHHTQRYIDANGHVRNEGDVQTAASAYGISYRALVPRQGEARNLIVPVCVSASHVAFGTIRMEPVFMQLGHVAGLAASLVIEQGVDVLEVDYFALRDELAAQGIKLPPTTLEPPDDEDPPTTPPELFYTGFMNGDFEEEPFDRYWSVSQNVLERPGFAPGSSRAAFIPVNPSSSNPVELVQNRPYWLDYVIAPVNNPATGEPTAAEFIPTEPRWRLEFYTVVSDPGATDKRSLNLLIGHERSDPSSTGANPPQINFRITGDGGAQAYSSGSALLAMGWHQVLPAGTFSFSPVLENSFPSPLVYHIQMEGDYFGPSPFYRVTARLDGANEGATSGEMRAWQYYNPLPGDGIVVVRAHGFIDAPYALDGMRLISVTDLPDGFVSWRGQFFSDAERADESISGPDVDLLGDGMSNFLRYALGLPPATPGHASLPVARVDEGNEGREWIFSFSRPAVVRDVIYEVQVSDDLRNWTDADAGVTTEADGIVTHIYRESEAGSGRRFFRLRVGAGIPE